MSDTLWWILSAALIALGLAGTLLPALPGTAFVLAGIVLGAWIDDFTRVGGVALTVITLMAVAAWVLRACWPGGSITGAPKVRACQRLNALEPVARGPYCGSLLRLDWDGSFDSSILIRTLMVKGQRLRLHAGCGIVADSDPQGEAVEMGWKIRPLLEALA